MANNNSQYASYEDYPVFTEEWEEMHYTPQSTEFMVWAPTAEAVRLSLYQAGLDTPAVSEHTMTQKKGGRWTVSIDNDLKGWFYTFNICIGQQWLGETPGVMAKAVGANGQRAAIINLSETNPEGWDQDRRPELKSFSDVILYEMHHRDFSINPNSGLHYHGKFLSLTEWNTRSFYGQASGLAHLLQLGVTHIHLLPSSDYATVDETHLDTPQYNWGYDPLNYNVPEGSYSTDPFNPQIRIREFKQMVQALHHEGLRIVMDVVYNHTYYNEESNFERTVPGYFYRHTNDGQWANGSGCHNETASERTMMRKFMVESVCYWAREYHVDGFRFDLMGIHDIATMNTIRMALNEIDPTICIYGEGWAACPPAYPNALLAMKYNAAQMPGIGCFSDEFREGLRIFCTDDGEGISTANRNRGVAGVKFGIVGGMPHPQLKGQEYQPQTWAVHPAQTINYVSCHDDFCIGDYLRISTIRATDSDRCRIMKLVETTLMTAQGIPFIFAGDEMMRNKKGVKNTYNASDTINGIDWRKKMEHEDLFTYICNIIDLRKSHPAFRLPDADTIARHLEFLPSDEGVVAFRINGKPNGETWQDLTVILNPHRQPTSIEVPEAEYRIVCHDGYINQNFGLSTYKGCRLEAAGQSATIAYKKE